MKKNEAEAINRLRIEWARSHGFPPLFIVFEGIDGSGKSTQAAMLAESMAQEGLQVLLTGEPSQGPVGLHIRSLKTRVGPEEEVSLFAKDRQDHLERTVKPALAEGRHVICDRYIHSSLAYQGARGVDPAIVLSENAPFLIAPDLIFLIEIPVDEALSRIKNARSGDFSPFEVREDLVAVNHVFSLIEDPLVRKINGLQPEDEIHKHIAGLVKRLIGKL